MFLRRKNVDIFFEQTGNPEGTDVLIVHGGPGAGINTEDRKVFPSSDWRVTDYDQRGCGKSKPRLDLEHNNTELLIEDIEALRKELGIESWVLSGGSWGTTLSLLYAIRYPERVQGLILRSVFLCRDADISWLFGPEGAARIYPDEWARLRADFGKPTGDFEIFREYEKNRTHRTTLAWSRWECGLCYHELPWNGFGLKDVGPADEETTVLEHHYLSQRGFLEENEILDSVQVLKDIPIEIIHGRYDFVCPIEQAYELSSALPNATLTITPSGHASAEPSLEFELRNAAKAMLKKLA